MKDVLYETRIKSNQRQSFISQKHIADDLKNKLNSINLKHTFNGSNNYTLCSI